MKKTLFAFHRWENWGLWPSVAEQGSEPHSVKLQSLCSEPTQAAPGYYLEPLSTNFTDFFFLFWCWHYLKRDLTTEFDLASPCWHHIRANLTTCSVFTKVYLSINSSHKPLRSEVSKIKPEGGGIVQTDLAVWVFPFIWKSFKLCHWHSMSSFLKTFKKLTSLWKAVNRRANNFLKSHHVSS